MEKFGSGWAEKSKKIFEELKSKLKPEQSQEILPQESLAPPTPEMTGEAEKKGGVNFDNIEASIGSGKPIEVRVQRTSGEMEGGWTISGFGYESGKELIKVMRRDEGGKLLFKTIPLEDLKKWNLPPEIPVVPTLEQIAEADRGFDEKIAAGMPPAPPTPEMMAGTEVPPAPVYEGPKEAAVEAEKKEHIKSPIEKTREDYARAGSELREKFPAIYSSFVGSGTGRDQLRATYPDLFPAAEEVLEKFIMTRGDYFDERQMDVKDKLDIFEQEMLAGLPGEKREMELRDFMAFHLAHEFKSNYDLKTQIKAEQELTNKPEKPGIMDKIYEYGKKYKELPLKKKLLISGALIGGGVVAGAIGGGAGLALATLVGGGRLTQRILSSGAAFIGLEGLIKKQQTAELNKEKIEKYQQTVSASLNKIFNPMEIKDPSDMVSFLRLNDYSLEYRAEQNGLSLKEMEKNQAVRRYLLAGSMSALTLFGFTSEALGNVVHGLGFHPEEYFAGPKIPSEVVKPEEISPVKATEIVEAVKAQEFIATVKQGGSISQAARSLLAEGKVSKEDFAHAWKNSFVEVNGLKVPISDVSLSHAGDQVIYVDGIGDAPGHFEVTDYADKFSLGSNRDLQTVFEMKNQEPPEWLKVATADDYKDALKDNNLDANDVKNVIFHQEHSNLLEQDEIMSELYKKTGELDPDKGGAEFANLFGHVTNSPAYESALQTYNNHVKLLGIKPEQFEAVKGMTVKDLLEKHGRSSWFDFFKGDSYARKVASYIRQYMMSEPDEKLTVDQFLKTIS